MVAMWVMEMPVDQIVDMIAMRYRLVPTARTVDMARFMVAAVCRASVRVLCADLDRVLVDMVPMRMVQMPVMKVVDMVAMPDCGVSASRAMLMIVVCVMRFVTRAHAVLLDLSGAPAAPAHWRKSTARQGLLKHVATHKLSAPRPDIDPAFGGSSVEADGCPAACVPVACMPEQYSLPRGRGRDLQCVRACRKQCDGRDVLAAVDLRRRTELDARHRHDD